MKEVRNMKNEDKTKEQFIDELVELRQRIAELEKSETEHLSTSTEPDKQREEDT